MLPSKPQPWFLALLLLAACGAPGVPDAGAGGGGGTTADAGKDAGTPDAGNDAGVPDAGTPDAGAPDAGALDAGAPDAGAPDAGVIDAGYPDNCTSPSDLVFPPDGGSVTFVANMNGANDEYVGSCHTVGNGPDLVYRIVLSQAASLRISSVGASGTALFYLRQSQCVTGPEVACAVAPVFGGTATRFIGFVPAGTYFLFIDSYAFTFGQQTVTVTAGPPASTPGDSCAAPLALFPDGGRSSAFVADTTGLGADMQGTCGGSGPEAVYHFALTAPADLDVLAVNDAGPRPIVYLRQSNCLTGIQVACRDLSINFSPIGHFFTNNLPAGDYYLVVDSSADGGTHAINADLKPPNPTPANDLCTSPQVLPGAGSYAGSTIGAGRQVGLSCLLSEADVFYSLTLTSAQDIGLRVSSTKPGFRPIIGLRATTCQSADLGCAGAPMPGTAAELTAYNRQPGTYLIIVSGQTVAPDDGTFTLDVTLSPPTLPPSNDTCTTPVILFADGGTIDSVATNLAPALGQHRSACTPGYGSNDVVYGFATTTPQRFHAALSTDAGVQPTMTLVPAANCTGPTMLATASAAGCVASHQPRATADLDVHALPAGAWLLVADTYGGVPGPVQLDVSLAAPAAAAANDTCATSETIPLTATPWGSSGLVTGDTTGASPNHLGLVCASDGPDLSYRVTTAAGAGAVNMRVSIASQNSTANLPSIHVRTACDPAMGSQLGCAAVKIPGPLDSLGAVVQAWGLQPGTEQWIWVDGAASSLGGAFTMQVDVAGPAANDVCATAQTLPINTSVAGSTLGATNDYAGTAPTGFYTGAITCLSALPGADVVYRFTAATTGFHRVEVVPQLGFDPGLAVLTACTPNACLATNDRNRTNELEEIQFQAAAGTSYFIVVDSRSDAQTSGNSRGGFIISVIGP